MPINTITINSGESVWVPKNSKILSIVGTNGITLTSSECIDTNINPPSCYKFEWEAQQSTDNVYGIVAVVGDNTEFSTIEIPLYSTTCNLLEEGLKDISPIYNYSDCCVTATGVGATTISHQTTLYLTIVGEYNNVFLKAKQLTNVMSGDTFIYIKGEKTENCSCSVV